MSSGYCIGESESIRIFQLIVKWWHVRIISIFVESCFFFEHMRKLFIWSHHTACGVLVFKPGIEPKLSALEVQSLNY